MKSDSVDTAGTSTMEIVLEALGDAGGWPLAIAAIVISFFKHLPATFKQARKWHVNVKATKLEEKIRKKKRDQRLEKATSKKQEK